MNDFGYAQSSTLTEFWEQSEDARFLHATHNLFSGAASGHMLPFFYSKHGGKDGRRCMSGDKAWVRITKDAAYYLSSQDRAVLAGNVGSLSSWIPKGLSMLDVAPGDRQALTTKSCLVAQACEISEYIGLDSSHSFASAAKEVFSRHLPASKVNALEIDAFKTAHIPLCERALIYFGGCTVGGLDGPISDRPPVEGLANMVEAIASHAHEAFVVLSYSNGHINPTRLLKAYNNPSVNDFKRNVLFRMADELNMTGFNPRLFEALSFFYPNSGAVAHKLVPTASQRFTLDGNRYHIGPDIQVGNDWILHTANSFQFSRHTMNEAVRRIGMEVLWHTQSKRPVKYVVIRKPKLVQANIGCVA